MIKGNSKDITFEQLMAQAADVAKAQDAALSEKAKERRKIEEAKRLKEEAVKRELERKEKELQKKKLEMEQRQQQLQQQKKKAALSNNISSINSHVHSSSSASSRKPSIGNQQRQGRSMDSKSRQASSSSKTKKNVSIPPPIVEKKKPVHISYEQLMEKAKEVSQPKKSTPSSATTATTPIKSTKDHSLPSSLLMNKSNKEIKGPIRTNTPPSSSSLATSSLYVKRPFSTVPKSKPKEPLAIANMRARDRIKLLHNTPLQQVQRVKRDRQSIEEIQRDIRHAKGKYSDNEEEEDAYYRKKQRMDQRPTVKNSNNNRPMDSGSSASRMKSDRFHSSPQRPYPPLQQQQRQPIRMPFKRVVDPKRDMKRRSRYQDEEEEDEDLDSFIVDDEEEEEEIGRRYNNDYSSEISKLFRYDRSKYANESIYSDDDMEAGTSEVLREEKRSERLARREDQLEEQLELERQKRKLAKSKRK
ncbi:SPT2 chromatin protein-domain-containing protein [Cunninghamella echinulata]|nr:SPT2 chromatin protein-domain-containing protein [Cunninghamella echinulata]